MAGLLLVQIFLCYFLSEYLMCGPDWSSNKLFWMMCRISPSQAKFDKEYLYGILVSATSHMQHKIILKFDESKDGIVAWHEFKQDYEYSGSKLIRLKALETMVAVPYSRNQPGGISTFIDKFQADRAELDNIAPQE